MNVNRRRAHTAAVVVLTALCAAGASGTTIRFPDENPSLAGAVAGAAPGDTVLISSGHYTSSTVWLATGVTVRSESGTPSSVTISSGSGGQVFRASSVSDVVLAGLTISDGTAVVYYQGGAIHCRNSSIALHDVVIEDSYAHNRGGGMYCYNSDVLLDGVIFRGNRAKYAGGGLFCDGCDVIVSNCYFESNEVGYIESTQTTFAYRGSGAGVHCEGSSSLQAQEVTFASNYSWYAGAGLGLSGAGTQAELASCAFVGSTTSMDAGTWGPEQNGAALAVTHDADVMLYNVEFSGNWSNHDGGAVACTEGGSAMIDGCTFSECEAAANGGAIVAFRSGDVSVTGCVFSRNSAGWGRGGALYSDPQGHLVSVGLSHCVLTENAAQQGGAVYGFAGTVDLMNCTLFGNDADGGSAVCFSRWSTGTVANCILSFGVGGDLVGGDAVVVRCCVVEPAPGSGLCEAPHENICADPLFCPVRAASFSLCLDSPCLPANNEWGQLIGAEEKGCGECGTSVQEATWGSIKAMYRRDRRCLSN